MFNFRNDNPTTQKELEDPSRLDFWLLKAHRLRSGATCCAPTHLCVYIFHDYIGSTFRIFHTIVA